MLPQGFVITTSAHTEPFLEACLNSLPSEWPILLVCNDNHIPTLVRNSHLPQGKDISVVYNDWNAFECGGVYQGSLHFDQFIHLMDSCVVVGSPPAPFDFATIFNLPGSVHFSPGFYSYLGKYRTEVLKRSGIPRIENKQQAIAAEDMWHKHYLTLEPNPIQYWPVLPVSSDNFLHLNNRRNMVLTNGLITKYKATWV